MSKAGGYLEYEFVAELYDYVVPYRKRPDVQFFVGAARESGDLYPRLPDAVFVSV